jgi:hypothetical protein
VCPPLPASETRCDLPAGSANPPPPPAESEPAKQPDQPAAQKPASGKFAIDVSQDEILLSWLNHGDELKQQWAMWYMHNPEEWIEYKASHQRQSSATTATTAAAGSSATNTTNVATGASTAAAAASAAPAASAAGADAQGDKERTAAAAAAAASSAAAAAAAASGAYTQQYSYPQSYAQVRTHFLLHWNRCVAALCHTPQHMQGSGRPSPICCMFICLYQQVSAATTRLHRIDTWWLRTCMLSCRINESARGRAYLTRATHAGVRTAWQC